MSWALAFCPFNWAFSCKSLKVLKWVQPSPDSCAMVKISLRFLFYEATHINVRLVYINSHSNISQRSWFQIPYGPEFFSVLISTTSSVVFIAARIFYIRFFTAVHIYDFHIFTIISANCLGDLSTPQMSQVYAALPRQCLHLQLWEHTLLVPLFTMDKQKMERRFTRHLTTTSILMTLISLWQ